MLLTALKTRAGLFLLGAVAVVVLALLATVGWLMHSRDGLLERNASLAQAMAQAKVTNERNQAEIARLEADLAWRDREAAKRKREAARREADLMLAKSELRELLIHAPCAGPEFVWPDLIFERMRAGTLADRDRDPARSSPGAVPDPDADAPAAPTD